RAVISHHPRSVEAFVGAAECAVRLSQPAEALTLFAQALELAPDHAGAIADKDTALLALTDQTQLRKTKPSVWEELRAGLVKELEVRPKDEQVLFILGHVLEAL